MVNLLSLFIIIIIQIIIYHFSYFRHAYRLGEHYNSVMPNGEVPDDEEWHNTE